MTPSCRAALLLVVLAQPFSASADPQQDEAAWIDAIARAQKTARPILAYVRPSDCLTPEGADPCRQIEDLLAHPAIQRRLEDFVFVRRTADGPPLLILHDLTGERLTSWDRIGRSADLSRVLTVIGGASQHIVDAHGARVRGDLTAGRRQGALALLQLGLVARGRGVIEEMATSDLAEDRELASLWLDALAAATEHRRRNEELLARLSKSGSTALVRFEALMAHGATQLIDGDVDSAVRTFTLAVDTAPETKLEANARVARQRALTRASPFVGIGEHDGIVIGRRTFKPRGLVKAAVRGEFTIDGRVAAKGVRPPFIVTLDFGRVPRRQAVEFRSYDSRGRELQRMQSVINERRDAFSIRIVEPAETRAAGTVRVSVAATVPRGRQIEHVSIEWRGAPIARFEIPPFAATIDIDPRDEGVLRAMIRLDDGSETEDARILNATSLTMSSNAHLVEVPVHVDGAFPAARNVVLRENGRNRTVERVVTPKEAPLRLALLLDTSLSMSEHLLDLQESAARLVERNLAPSDRATLIAFGGSESVLWPTADPKTIVRTILSLQTHGGTALYSAIVSAFLNLQSPGYRRAIVLFTDGVDTGSAFTVEEVEEVARRMAIPLYVLAFTPRYEGVTPYRGGRIGPSTESSTFQLYGASRAVGRISRDSGGQVFKIDSLDGIDAVWSRVAEDLRQQALIVYRPSDSTHGWRSLEIKVPGQRLRAPKGVYVEVTR